MELSNHYPKSESPLVTIGIPVYNVEPYIEKCLLSVLNQTYQNLEILVVDDLGTDNSMEIVNEIQQSHPLGNCINIKLIVQIIYIKILIKYIKKLLKNLV